MNPSEMKALEKKALDRIVKQRMALVLRQPFFGSLALRLKLVPAWWVPTCAVDGKSFFYNPAFVEKQTDAQLRGLTCHEVLHCANGHPWRRGGRDPQLSNIAQDYAINPICIEAKFELPEGGLIDERFRPYAWEQIYAMLRDEAEQERREQQEQQQAEGDQEGEEGAGGGDESNSDEGQGSGAGDQGDKAPSKPGQGQGKGNTPASDSAGEHTDPRAPKYEPTFGEVLDAPAETAAKDEADWKVAVVQAYEAAKAQGKVPAGVEALIEEFVQPAVDWKAVLRRFVQSCAALDYTWRLPSPRYMASGLYLPRLQSESMPPIVVVNDTSGSTASHQAQFFGELGAIIEEASPERVWYVQSDAKVHKVEELAPGDPIVPKVYGGGGTSFVPAFEHVEREAYDPACMIYMTDCYGDFPTEDPGYPVLWASTVKWDALPETYRPPFGEFIYIGDME